jgi:filamentous hemagglutinin
MAIGRISGPMLKADLERQGVDLSVDTDLLYFDVQNRRIGINKDVPNAALDITGSAIFNDAIEINTNTISTQTTDGNITLQPNGSGQVRVSSLTAGRIVYVGTLGSLEDSSSFTWDGTTIAATGSAFGNVTVSANTIDTSSGNLNITSTGGEVTASSLAVTDLTSGRVLLAGTSGAVEDSTNLTFNGTTLTVTGNVAIDNVTVDGNQITTSAGNLSLDSTGGEVTASSLAVSDLTSGRVLLAGTSGALEDSADLTFDGTNFDVANVRVAANTISTTAGALTIEPNNNERLIVDTASALTLGDIRYNSDTTFVEYYNGADWQSFATQSNILIFEEFAGDGSTTDFTLSQTTTSNATIITLNGVVQSPGTAYSISGTNLTFTQAPEIDDSIEVRYISDVYTPSSIISDSSTTVTVDNSSGTAIASISGSAILTVDASGIQVTGSIIGTGSIASVSNSTPAGSSASGTKGDVRYDSSYIYVCVATDTWIRASIDNSF